MVAGEAQSIGSLRLNHQSDSYTIESGTTSSKIFNDLTNHPISPFLLKVHMKLNNISVIQAGHYDISNIVWKDFLLNLSIGKTKTFKFTIPEGSTTFEISELINRESLIDDCLNLSCLVSPFGFVEGTLMPETYFYKFGANASMLLNKSQKELEVFLTKIWSEKSADNPLTSMKDALILASIVEKEAGNNSEKSIVAGVFLHRLSINMRLQADPTIIYGLLPGFNGDITKANLRDKENVFNTYQISGLPPTPISTISKKSLEAVILSSPNKYLYFVGRGDGSHQFSKTYKEHLEAVKKYQLSN